jgi:hypothetical protein
MGNPKQQPTSNQVRLLINKDFEIGVAHASYFPDEYHSFIVLRSRSLRRQFQYIQQQQQSHFSGGDFAGSVQLSAGRFRKRQFRGERIGFQQWKQWRRNNQQSIRLHRR